MLEKTLPLQTMISKTLVQTKLGLGVTGWCLDNNDLVCSKEAPRSYALHLLFFALVLSS
jgi:hypothetical protein